MSKIAKTVCALAGAAVNGAVAAISGGNPILVAISGGASNLISEEVGEIVREDEIVVKLFGEKGKEEQKKAFAALLKGEEKLPAATKTEVEKVKDLVTQIVAEQKLQNSALAEMLRPISEKTAEEQKSKAEKAEAKAKAEAEDVQLANFVALYDKVEAYKARMAKAEKKAHVG